MYKDKEKKRAWENKYQRDNPEKIREMRKRSYQKNKHKYVKREKEYRKKNKDKIKAYRKEHYLREKDEISAWKKDYYQKNKDEISEKAKERYQKYEDVRERARLRAKNWRNKNPEKQKEYRKKKKEHIKEHKRGYYELKAKFVLDYKKDKCCANCGYKEHTEILQFHHTKGDKSFSVGSGIGNKKNEIIKTEMDKCILLCPNCHFLLHSHKKV